MMAAAPAERTKTTAVPLFSGDGLRWRPARETKLIRKREGKWLAWRVPEENLAIPEFLEHAGLYKWDGMYHIAGQQISPWVWLWDGQPSGRVMSIFRSSDFVEWSDTKSLSFVRYGYRSMPTNEGEESHEPASVWNRGNVLLGTYGQFHGAPGSPAHPMDLGLLISNDGIHFREPVPDFVFLPRGDPGSWEGGGLLQGQGFENVGDETYIWYGGWDNDVTRPDTYGEIGLARWRRDGFGSLSVKNPEHPAAFVTCPIQARGDVTIHLNAEGLSERAWLRVELLGSERTAASRILRHRLRGSLQIGFEGTGLLERQAENPGTFDWIQDPGQLRRGETGHQDLRPLRRRVNGEGVFLPPLPTGGLKVPPPPSTSNVPQDGMRRIVTRGA